ncbi:MAG: SagB/ThcOx family dehydrogenase [Syntrophobacteraceae bacterium]|nr:SagB/ThcOx family dehydrogenase [Syntrophobacteraceae bacterium]
MKYKSRSVTGILLAFLFTFHCSLVSFAAEPASIKLPAAQKAGGKPLMAALNGRMSSRSFSGEKLPVQTLSNLLWAAFGINRPDGKRTAPSALNRQETDIYVITADGAYLYDAKKNTLEGVLKKDIRTTAGTQDYVKDAPLTLVYVADYSKARAGSADNQLLVGADVGVIAENVYLFCASEGLATVVRAAIDRDALGRELKLRPQQKIILDQPVGYPKK